MNVGLSLVLVCLLRFSILVYLRLFCSSVVCFYWATICKTVHPMLSDRCLSCLSVTLGHCGGQTVGWIEMKLGVQVGLGCRHIVLDGDPAPPPPRGTAPQFSAHICCGQMAAWIKNMLICFVMHPRSTSSECNIGSRPSDHYFRSVCLFVCLAVCLFVCAEFFSAIFDPISIKLGHMLYVWV